MAKVPAHCWAHCCDKRNQCCDRPMALNGTKTWDRNIGCQSLHPPRGALEVASASCGDWGSYTKESPERDTHLSERKPPKPRVRVPLPHQPCLPGLQGLMAEAEPALGERCWPGAPGKCSRKLDGCKHWPEGDFNYHHPYCFSSSSLFISIKVH